MTLVELDTLRADTMRSLLNEQGRQHIWRYDVTTAQGAFAEARADWNFDNMSAYDRMKPYVLIGGDIVDQYFSTPEELVDLVRWLCLKGPLSCYAADVEAAS